LCVVVWLQLAVLASSGARWVFDLMFESLPAQVDDTISIEADLHRTSAVAFRLANQVRLVSQYHQPKNPLPIGFTS
jgi:hypothetical protein